MNNALIQHEVEIVEKVEESPSVFTFRLRFTDPKVRQEYSFMPGQFNMVYLYGVGEVAISIVSDPACHVDECLYDHTFRVVGRVTRGLANLNQGDRLGIRGPFGNGWPVDEAENKDVIVVTGGLGCAPSVSAVNYIHARRENYGALKIFQGVKCSGDLIYCDLYKKWDQVENTKVFLSSDEADPKWEWNIGSVVENLAHLEIDPHKTICMMCGPEGMMKAAAEVLLMKKINADDIHLSMERNMKCGIGQCGHCQFGSQFVCKDGPVFTYTKIKELLGVKGF